MNEVISFDYADLRKAIYNFLKAYLQPEINAKAIIWGNQNNISLPAGTNDYCIFYIQNQIRHGTNVNLYDADEETFTMKETSEVVVRVDCYADSRNSMSGINAQQRAHNLELLIRSPVACAFFKEYKISPLYADAAQDTTIVSASNNYLHRWTVNLHLSFINSLTVAQEGFTEVKPFKMNSLSQTESGMHIIDADVFAKSN